MQFILKQDCWVKLSAESVKPIIHYVSMLILSVLYQIGLWLETEEEHTAGLEVQTSFLLSAPFLHLRKSLWKGTRVFLEVPPKHTA